MSSSYEPLFFVAVAVFVCRIHWQIVDRVKSYGFGCYIKDVGLCVSVFLYADDISTLSVLSAAAHVYMWRWTLVAGSDY